MRCQWCQADLLDKRARYCSKKCRQTAYRLRCRCAVGSATSRPMRMAYADPPYPGLAKRYYGKESSYAGEVDHSELIASLMEQYDGWALSTSSKSLRDILPMCPSNARVCAWVKPVGAPARTRGLHGIWEPVIVVSGRQLSPGTPDALRAHAARGGGTLIGRKPIAFCAWLFDCLGLVPGDQLIDLFPGTGIVSRAWRELSTRGIGDASVPRRRLGEYSSDISSTEGEAS